MNLGIAHSLIVGLAIIAATLLGATHSLPGHDVETIILAAIGSLTGHGVGYAHGMQTALKTTETMRAPAPATEETVGG